LARTQKKLTAVSFFLFKYFRYLCVMSVDQKIWDDISAADRKYKYLRLSESVDYDKFHIYSIVTHSTAIEGSTLTERETQLLFDEGLTAKNKPLLFHLMNEDLKNAYLFAVDRAAEKRPITPEFLRELNALVMKSTGARIDAITGSFDASKGDFRRVGVHATGGRSYMSHAKVPDSVDALCGELARRSATATGLRAVYELSFDAHLNLVTIHPWVDGNGRTARLLMNYLQLCAGVVPSKIHREDRAEYIDALNRSQEMEDPSPFRQFMARQHLKTLREDIRAHEKSLSKANAFTLLF
jgi:Fic family protein